MKTDPIVACGGTFCMLEGLHMTIQAPVSVPFGADATVELRFVTNRPDALNLLRLEVDGVDVDLSVLVALLPRHALTGEDPTLEPPTHRCYVYEIPAHLRVRMRDWVGITIQNVSSHVLTGGYAFAFRRL